MLFSVNPNDGLPIYRQLVRQVRHALASRALKPGDRLPSQRELSAELVISHLTVKKAYEILESQGLITTLRGRGTFVATGLPGRLRGEGLSQLRLRAAELADAARLLGVDRRRFLELLRSAWKAEKEMHR